MLLKLDKESLSNLSSSLKQEVEKYDTSLDSIITELDNLNTAMQGEIYNNYLNNYNERKKQFLQSKDILESYQNIIEKSLINYTTLQEGIGYNE